MRSVEVWRVWAKTEEKSRKRRERRSERQERQQELLLHVASQRGKNSVTSRKDHEVKRVRMTSAVHSETTWEGGVAVILQRAVRWGREWP